MRKSIQTNLAVRNYPKCTNSLHIVVEFESGQFKSLLKFINKTIRKLEKQIIKSENDCDMEKNERLQQKRWDALGILQAVTNMDDEDLEDYLALNRGK